MQNNIYGYLAEKSKVILCMGSYNNIYGTLILNEFSQILFKSFSTIEDRDIKKSYPLLEFTLLYNKIENIHAFTLYNSQFGLYLFNNELKAEKIWYKIPENRPYLLSGKLLEFIPLSMENKILSWNVQNSESIELVSIIPINYIPKDKNLSEFTIKELIKEIKNSSLCNYGKNEPFFGYTDNEWKKLPYSVAYCEPDEQCGKCLGKCESDFICIPGKEEFVCVSNKEKLFDEQEKTDYWGLIIIIIMIILSLILLSFVAYYIIKNKN